MFLEIFWRWCCMLEKQNEWRWKTIPFASWCSSTIQRIFQNTSEPWRRRLIVSKYFRRTKWNHGAAASNKKKQILEQHKITKCKWSLRNLQWTCNGIFYLVVSRQGPGSFRSCYRGRLYIVLEAGVRLRVSVVWHFERGGKNNMPCSCSQMINIFQTCFGCRFLLCALTSVSLYL